MASFDTEKIEVLFSLCLAKAKVGRARNEYGKLSTAINDLSPFQEAKISQKYLDENIDKRLTKAQEEGKAIIGLKRDYVQDLAVFLGYESYWEFEEAFNVAIKLLSIVKTRQIRVFYNKGRKNEPARTITDLSYPDQTDVPEVSLCEIPEKLSLFEEDKELPLTILWVDQDWLRSQSLEVGDLRTEDPLLLLASQNKDGETSLTTITHHQFAICFQILTIGLTPGMPTKSVEKEKKLSHSRPIIIKDSGAINLGNIRSIKAKYISSRDMTINIKKKG